MDCKWTCCPPQCNSCGWRTLRMCDVHKLICVGGYLKKDFHVHHAKAASCSFHLYFVYLEFLYQLPYTFPLLLPQAPLHCECNCWHRVPLGANGNRIPCAISEHRILLPVCLSVRSSVLRCRLLLRCLLSCLVLVSKFCNFFARLKTNSLK